MKKVWIASILTCIILMLPITNVVSASEIDEDCLDCQPVSRVDLLKVKLLLIRLKTITNIIKSRFGHIPEIREKCKEASQRIADIIVLSNSSICVLLGLLLIPIGGQIAFLGFILDTFRNTPLYDIVYSITYPYSLILIYSLGKLFDLIIYYDCFPTPPPPLNVELERGLIE